MNSPEADIKSRMKQIKYPTLWVAGFVILIIVAKTVMAGHWGQIGRDSDDTLRLVQIKDFLAGQSWFHTDQYRMGLAGGTDMHWSRLPDIPIILLTKIFDIFMPEETALKWAYSLWPVLTAGLFIAAMTKAAKFWGGEKNITFTWVLLAIFAFGFYRFQPGSIDHHNIQMVLVASALAFALDPQARAKSFFICGLSVAGFVAIGVEVYLFAAIFSAYMALTWAFHGEPLRGGAIGYGLGLAAGLGMAFFATITPSEYGRVYCDALSLITVSAGIAGGAGLAIAATLLSGKAPLLRWAGLAVIGGVCLVILGFQAPQCLANPLDALPEDVVEMWLNTIQEAKPLFDMGSSSFASISFKIGAPILAMILLFWHILKNRVWDARYLVAGLLLSALALTVYQVRFSPFAYMFALVPLAAWIARVYVKGRKNGESNILYLLALALSVQLIWGLPGILLGNSAKANLKSASKSNAATCYDHAVMQKLNALPAGIVSANSNGAGKILMHTDHHVLSGNYHRNWEGILTQIRIATSPPEAAYDLLKTHNVDYLHYCQWDVDTKTFTANYKDSL